MNIKYSLVKCWCPCNGNESRKRKKWALTTANNAVVCHLEEKRWNIRLVILARNMKNEHTVQASPALHWVCGCTCGTNNTNPVIPSHFTLPVKLSSTPPRFYPCLRDSRAHTQPSMYIKLNNSGVLLDQTLFSNYKTTVVKLFQHFLYEVNLPTLSFSLLALWYEVWIFKSGLHISLFF